MLSTSASAAAAAAAASSSSSSSSTATAMSLGNWITRPSMVSIPMVGKYVRIDPFDIDQDMPLLWDALGGNDNTIQERLKWWGLKDLQSSEELCDVLQSMILNVGGCNSINIFRLVSTNEIAGMASFISTNQEHGTTEVGFVAHGEAMKKSCASTEAHYLLARYAFETQGYRRLEWKCDSNNIPSNKTAKRYGYSFEGCFRQHRITARMTNRDTNWYSIIDSDWSNYVKRAFELWLDPSNFDENGKQLKRLEDIRDSL